MTEDAEYKRKRRKRGICYYCRELAEPGKSACEKHRISHYWAGKKYRETHRARINSRERQRKKERIKRGLCRDCSAPLNAELDTGFRTCLNCRGKTRRPQWVTYGTY